MLEIILNTDIKPERGYYYFIIIKDGCINLVRIKRRKKYRESKFTEEEKEMVE